MAVRATLSQRYSRLWSRITKRITAMLMHESAKPMERVIQLAGVNAP